MSTESQEHQDPEKETPESSGDDTQEQEVSGEAGSRFTNEDVERIVATRLAKATRSFERRLEEALAARDGEAKAALERVEGSYREQLSGRMGELEALRAALAEKERELGEARQAVVHERATSRLAAELNRWGVVPQFAEKAMKLAGLEITDFAVDEGGQVTATYGDFVGQPLHEIARLWANDNPQYLAPPPSGAGTRPGNHLHSNHSPRLTELSTNELIKRANTNR